MRGHLRLLLGHHERLHLLLFLHPLWGQGLGADVVFGPALSYRLVGAAHGVPHSFEKYWGQRHGSLNILGLKLDFRACLLSTALRGG